MSGNDEGYGPVDEAGETGAGDEVEGSAKDALSSDAEPFSDQSIAGEPQRAERFGDFGADGQIGILAEEGHLGQIGQVANLGDIGQLADVGHIGQIAQLGDIGEIAQVGHFGHVGHIGDNGHFGDVAQIGQGADIGDIAQDAHIGILAEEGHIGIAGVLGRGGVGQEVLTGVQEVELNLSLSVEDLVAERDRLVQRLAAVTQLEQVKRQAKG